MRFPVVRFTLVCCLLVVTACGSELPTPPAGPSERFEFQRVTVVDQAGLERSVIDSIGAAVERDWDAVAAVFAPFSVGDPPARVTFRILRGNGIPFVTPGESTMTQWADGLRFNYIPHQLTHLWTRYTRSLFLEEGIAVYMSELLRPLDPDVNPYRGQPPHAWVTLFVDHGSIVSLFTALRADGFAYDFRGSPSDAVAWQVFLEAGSFTRWVFDAHGADAWFALFDSEDLGAVLGNTVDVERDWTAAARAAHPDPRPCEEALGAITSREEFWCARARGQ